MQLVPSRNAVRVGDRCRKIPDGRVIWAVVSFAADHAGNPHARLMAEGDPTQIVMIACAALRDWKLYGHLCAMSETQGGRTNETVYSMDWHHDGLLPIGREPVEDRRTRIVQGDFFSMAAAQGGFSADAPGRHFHAILVDIDHSPDALLDVRSRRFYGIKGLAQLACHLHPGGIFGLWSNDRPDPRFEERLRGVFAKAWAEPVTFFNPLQDRTFTQTVYLARKSGHAEAGAVG